MMFKELWGPCLGRRLGSRWEASSPSTERQADKQLLAPIPLVSSLSLCGGTLGREKGSPLQAMPEPGGGGAL